MNRKAWFGSTKGVLFQASGFHDMTPYNDDQSAASSFLKCPSSAGGLSIPTLNDIVRCKQPIEEGATIFFKF
jgi:hypothetical protein